MAMEGKENEKNSIIYDNAAMFSCGIVGKCQSGGEKERKIPKKIKGYTVVQIGRMEGKTGSIFSEEDTEQLKQIKLPNTLQKIGAKSLKGCVSLIKMDFPQGLHYIGAHAMEKCYKIKKVILPKDLKNIGNYAFYRCKAIEKAVLKTNKAKIGTNAFATRGFGSSLEKEESHLKEIEMPVTYKGRIIDDAFCGYIGETFTWGNLTAANGAFFRGVHTLKKIKIHKNAKEVDIPRNCLNDCAKQLEIVVPKYVKKVCIGQQHFNIKQITIQGLDTTLEGDYAMGIGNPHIMISVETVKCKKKSVAWDMA